MSGSLFRVLLLLLLVPVALQAQKQLAPTVYMVEFTDKKHNLYSVTSPQNYLSNRAIERRTKQNIRITENDLPIAQAYVDSLILKGFTVLRTSKWLNAAIVQINSPEQLHMLNAISIIKHDAQTQNSQSTTTTKVNKQEPADTIAIEVTSTFYGASYTQSNMLEGTFLHKKQYFGQGMLIAVLDGGFMGAPAYGSLHNLWTENRVVLQRDIADPSGNSFFQDAHGANVLSIMAGIAEGQLVGTAPKASYALIRTEVGATEYPIEEFNWVVGAELADSIGADIINSSLGYSQFDEASYNHTYADMDGKTALSSIGAEIASTKGMVVVVSAGNEGNNPWKYISAPSDAQNVLCIGAISPNKVLAAFSSRGPASDKRIKPDVVAVGWGTVVQSGNSITTGSGTSYSAPVISGLIACLWQACPYKTNFEIMDAIRKSAHQYTTPDSLMGFGIPNYQKALFILEPLFTSNNKEVYTFPNPVIDELNLKFGPTPESASVLYLYDISGRLIATEPIKTNIQQINYISSNILQHTKKGIYIVKIVSGPLQLKKQIVKF